MWILLGWSAQAAGAEKRGHFGSTAIRFNVEPDLIGQASS
jgi:hypothetical protein